jgi:protein phosphatase
VENSSAALEVMSRFASNPKWLIYLPPTMSPSETSERHDLLEHPAEALDYFRKAQVERVICEQQHMGSRAVVIVCRDRDAALRRFGVTQDEIGVCYTRTGRRFFNDGALEKEFLGRVQAAVTKSGLWDDLATDWLCIDAELMPWSSKAQDLLRQQYAPTGAAARAGLAASIDALRMTSKLVPEASELTGRYEERRVMTEQYIEHIAATAGQCVRWLT